MTEGSAPPTFDPGQQLDDPFRTIRKGQFANCDTGVINEITFADNLFREAA